MSSTNRKGEAGSMLMLVVFLFLLLMIAGGIVAGTFMFFGTGYEVRQLDADVLNYKIKECMTNNYILMVVDSFYEVCGLNKEVLEQAGYKINICEGVCSGNLPGIISVGSNFEVCKFTGKGEGYPKCTISSVVKEGKSYEIVVASLQMPRRVSE
ncbi:MAG: hypothetical protein Q8L29_00855 [archaeon]|nr:hypothetical protein [archaeon]